MTERSGKRGGSPDLPAADVGLLLLRGAGLLLASTFGRQKIVGLAAHLQTGAPLDAWGLARFLRSLGFPAPALLAFGAALNESAVALFVAAGFFTRLFAASLAAGMSVAFFVSLKLGEEPLRALLYAFIFAAVAVAGPGRFSIDGRRAARKESGDRAAVPAAGRRN